MGCSSAGFDGVVSARTAARRHRPRRPRRPRGEACPCARPWRASTRMRWLRSSPRSPPRRTALRVRRAALPRVGAWAGGASALASARPSFRAEGRKAGSTLAKARRCISWRLVRAQHCLQCRADLSAWLYLLACTHAAFPCARIGTAMPSPGQPSRHTAFSSARIAP